MPRFQKIALIAVVSTFIMVVIGVIVRSTGSGMGCPDWPLCHGQIIPPTGDSAAWLEWIHRFWGVVIGFVMLGLVIEAFMSPGLSSGRDRQRERDSRRTPSPRSFWRPFGHR